MTRTGFKNIISSIIIILLYFLWNYLVEGIVTQLNLSGNIELWFKAFLFLLLLVVIAIFYRQELQKAFLEVKSIVSNKILNSLKIFCLGYIIYLIISLIIKIILPDIYYVNNMAIGFESIPAIYIFFTLIYYPIVEELIFKTSFKKVLTNKVAFIFLTGFLNAFFQVAFSFKQPIDLLIIIPDTIFYMTLSCIYYETDNILVDIFYRVLSNLLPVIATLMSVSSIFMKLWR